MKIAYFLDEYFWDGEARGIGGAGNVLLEQAKIISRIHEVVVVLPQNERGEINPEYLSRCKKAGLRCLYATYRTANSIQDIAIIEAGEHIEEIKEIALHEKIDFFHSAQLNISVELASRELGIPHLMNIYQLCNEEFVLNCMDIFPRYHSCDSWLYCSVWKQNLRVKTRCIRPSAPLPEIHRKKRVRNNESINILMLGGCEKRKNQLSAIQAIEICNRKDSHLSLTIAGNAIGRYAEECIEYVEKRGLQDTVRIIGFQSNIVPLLEESDCYLCASTEESFPSSIVEALTYDLTIISTPVAGVPELLVDGVNAYISKGYEGEEIAECLMECVSGYKDASVWELHKQAEMLWKENFSPDTIKKQLNDYYTDILNDFSKSSYRSANDRISYDDIRNVYDILSGTELQSEISDRYYYYTCLIHILETGNAYIWGAGNFGRIARLLSEKLFPKIRILAYVDKEKRGDYLGLPIISPEMIKSEDVSYVFLGFANGRDDAVKDLNGKGFKYNKDIWILP